MSFFDIHIFYNEIKKGNIMLLEILGAFVLCDIVDSIKNIGKKLTETIQNYLEWTWQLPNNLV